jgi:hypothetical protein
MRFGMACLLLALAIPTRGDEIVLKGGRRLVGEIVERTSTSVSIEIAPGRVTLPLSAVDRIVSGPSALSTFRQRASRLASEDAAGWLALGIWALERGLATQATLAFERTVAVQPDNAQAQEALGHVRVGERWMTREEGYRAQGLVLLEGDWVTPQERDSRLAQRHMETETERRRLETDARLREAEARVRQAEAEARRADAEAAALAQPSMPIVPLWPYGGSTERRTHPHGRRGHAPRDPQPQATPSASREPPRATQHPVAQPSPIPPVTPSTTIGGAHGGVSPHSPE